MGERREYAVTVHSTTELDEDRVEEWVHANFDPGSEQVQIQDVESGEIVFDII